MALRTWFARLVALLAAAVAAPAPAQQAAVNPRIALVVGEQTYRDQTLATTANDAGLVAQTLQAAGFDVVGARDLDGQSLRTAVRDFLDKAAAAGPDLQAFVYLAGRGVQYAGDNFFVPIDATLRRDADVPIEAIRVGDFVHALATLPGRARIVVLDAARVGPYATEGAPLAPGLALVDAEPGVLIAFNATPGTLAGDEQGPYGVYGKTLAGAIRQGGLDIAEAFDQTRVLVNQETQGALLPWNASNLGARYYVFERAADAPAPPVAAAIEQRRQPMTRYAVDDAYAIALQRDTMAGYREFLAAYPHSDQARRVRAILAARREAEFWRRTRDANSPRAYWTYLRAYPRGPHVADARRRLMFLSAAYEPPPDFEPIPFAGLPPPPPDEIFFAEQPVYAFDDFGPPPPPPPGDYGLEDDDDWRALPPPPPPPELGMLPVLEVGIPVIVGAVAYQGHHHWRHDGVAPRGAPVFAPPPPASPPLPPGVRPVAPPPSRPIVSGGGAPRGPVVRPLPSIALAPGNAAQPGTRRPAPGAGNAPPARPNPAAPAAPAKKPAETARPQPAPAPATTGGAPAAAPSAKAPATTLPAGTGEPPKPPAANPPGAASKLAKPRPAPAAGGAPTVPPGGKPPPPPSTGAASTPAGKPESAPAKPAPSAGGAPNVPSAGKPLPTPAPAPAANPPQAPSETKPVGTPRVAPAKLAPSAPTPSGAPKIPTGGTPARAPAGLSSPAPSEAKPVHPPAPIAPPPAAHALPPPPAPEKSPQPQVHAPPQPAPVPAARAPVAPAPVIHAPPPPAPLAPAQAPIVRPPAPLQGHQPDRPPAPGRPRASVHQPTAEGQPQPSR